MLSKRDIHLLTVVCIQDRAPVMLLGTDTFRLSGVLLQGLVAGGLHLNVLIRKKASSKEAW